MKNWHNLLELKTPMLKNIILLIALVAYVSFADAQKWSVVRANKQVSFPATVPAGNYSGIAHVGGDRFVVVNDKSATDGFCEFSISIDSISGQIVDVKLMRTVDCGEPNRDGEGIAFVAADSTVYVVGETDNVIKAYSLDGKLTGNRVNLRQATDNLGYESLSYNDITKTLWTANESTFVEDGQRATAGSDVENVIRLQSFGSDLTPKSSFLYRMDKPTAHKNALHYALGVSELAALDDGTVLVLEREFFVPKSKLGAFVRNKLYQVNPTDADSVNIYEPFSSNATLIGKALEKHLLYDWQTHLTLFDRSLANYEGMCMAEKLKDGSIVLLLVSDSQNQYAGVLKDWFKTIVISKENET